MKFIKWKILFITSMVCLLPILPGVVLWERLPDTIAIHFDMYNNPDNFAPKRFVVFALPVLMVLLQCFCCFVNDINAKKHGNRRKFELATKWIIPIMTVILQGITFCIALGWDLDVRKVTMSIVGIVFLVIGNYLPKFDYIKNYNLDTEKARKINRFIGFETVLMGILGIITIFLPPAFSVLWLVFLIPYAIIGAIYAVKVCKKTSNQ